MFLPHTQAPEGRGWSGGTKKGTPSIFMEEGVLMEQVVTLIQTVGFPIACAVAMFIMLSNEQKAHKEETEKLTATINELKTQFAETINNQKLDMVSAINNNTLVIQKLLDKLDGD